MTSPLKGHIGQTFAEPEEFVDAELDRNQVAAVVELKAVCCAKDETTAQQTSLKEVPRLDCIPLIWEVEEKHCWNLHFLGQFGKRTSDASYCHTVHKRAVLMCRLMCWKHVVV